MDPGDPNPDAEDLYDRLGLPRTASSRDVKKAFRAAAARYHPDQSEAHRDGRAFRRLCEARDVLSDWIERRDYDRATLHAAPASGPTAPGEPAPARPRRAPREAPDGGTWLGRWEPLFPRVQPWVVTARNASVVLAIGGNLAFLNAVVATDPDRLVGHWRDLVTWDVLLLEALYISLPITLQLIALAMRPGSASRA